MTEGGRNWAHQDSNLERAGYEPAALTIELWARRPVYRTCCQPCPARRHESIIDVHSRLTTGLLLA